MQLVALRRCGVRLGHTRQERVGVRRASKSNSRRAGRGQVQETKLLDVDGRTDADTS
jgi:hypothetical protein